ncbi:cytochrome b [Tabrizicola sp.]|uniref:cytochrome b n=1 Tax=Tabrizicola sp. TaxID=2005166 RepID=UPI00286C7CFD|nr:cytochrome b [Tabrizicola sp.]
MAFRNTPDSFGLITRVLHWAMALLVLTMLALGLRISDMEPGLSNLWLYGLHKTLGFGVLTLIVLRLGWHLISPVPKPIGPPGLAQLAARAGHILFYVLLIAIPISGWAGSSATGIDVMIADRWVVQPIAEVSEAGEAFWFSVHEVLTKILIGLIIVHMLAALKRELAGDGTLRRMIRGRV